MTAKTDARISVIITVMNEEKTIFELLEALRAQTQPAAEVIITDGGSVDQTQLIIRKYAQTYPKMHLQLFQKKGNRSVGRNEAIRHANSSLIAITDAGCIPHKDWLAKLEAAYLKHCFDSHFMNSTDPIQKIVIAGYYDSAPKTPFEEAVVPYVLVMPGKVNPSDFLPATRSMLVTREVWEELGGFDEKLSDNEDYALAQKIHQKNISIFFTDKAKVTWIPRQNLQQFFWMIFRFARGDAYAGIWRKRVIGVFGRYAIGVITLLLLWLNGGLISTFSGGVCALSIYSLWAIYKNQRYVPNGWYWLPILQITADVGVIWGSIAGVAQKI